MFAQVQVIAPQKPDAILVPTRGGRPAGQQPVVFVNDNGKASQRPVQIGHIDNKSIEIVSGVAAGEQVVVVGQTGLRDGAPIQVVNPAAGRRPGPGWPGAGRPGPGRSARTARRPGPGRPTESAQAGSYEGETLRCG